MTTDSSPPQSNTDDKEIEVELLPAEADHDDDISGDATAAAIEVEGAAVSVQPLEDDLTEEEPPAVEKLPARISKRPSRASGNRSKDVVPYDALSAYLREIRHYPKLTREEEHELAVKYYEHQDLQAAYSLVKSTLWLVVKIARDYERAAKNLLDLVQEGNIGLMEAVKNYDPYRGVRFPSYAVWWVKAYIIRYIMANLRMVKLGTTQAQRKLFFNLKKEKEKLERAGFTPGPKLLAEKLNVKESEIVEMEQRLGSPDVSVDAPVQSNSETDLLSLLDSGELTAEDLVNMKQVKELISSSLDDFAGTLNEKEQVIFEERMLSEDRATLQDLADKLSLSRERIRQIENKIKTKLRDYLTDKFGSNIDQLLP